MHYGEDIKFGEYARISTSGIDFVSLEIAYHAANRWLRFSQRKYIVKALERVGMTDCKPAETPFQQGIRFTEADMPEVPDARRISSYRKMMGIANWVVRNTCPEGMFAVSYLSQFLSNPSEKMHRQLCRLFRYFKFTIEHNFEGITFRVQPHHAVFGQGGMIPKNQLYGYVDATFSTKEDSRYTELWFLNGMLVEKRTGKLKTGLSSTENEFVALSQGGITGKFIGMVLDALHEKQGTILIAQDNKSCVHIAENPGRLSVGTKHIDVKVRWIQEAIEDGTIGLVWVPRHLMIADIGNQAQKYSMHKAFTEALRGHSLPDKKPEEAFQAKVKKHRLSFAGHWAEGLKRPRFNDEMSDDDTEYEPIIFE